MSALSPEVIEFAANNVSSVEDLHVLLTCIDTPDRWWDAQGMARELGMGVSASRRSLDRLARGNLLDIRITGDVRYRFRPGTSELESQAVALVDAYRRNPTQATEAIRG